MWEVGKPFIERDFHLMGGSCVDEQRGGAYNQIIYS